MVMAFVVVLAVLMARQINQARAQQKAAEAIQQAGGRVRYDYDYLASDPISSDFVQVTGGKPWAPDWLTKAVGDDYFREISTVTIWSGRTVPIERLVESLKGLKRIRVLEMSGCDDRELALLAGLDRIEGFNLSPDDGGITDSGLASLAILKRLRYLSLSKSRITDSGLAALEDLRDLEYLHLDEAPIAGPGLVHLRGLSRLRSLSLTNTKLDEAGLANLPELDQLRTLMLQQTRIGDASLSRIVHSKQLDYLNISYTQVTDEGLRLLVGLKRLENLDLTGTKINDAGLLHLAEITSLKELRLGRWKGITPAGVAALQAKLPSLVIIR
jgi:Leucine-rich repeat (LRR) protein